MTVDGGSLRVLELFSGIGGCAAALDGAVRVVGACDVSRPALAVYSRNFPRHPVRPRALESIPAAELGAFHADLWWLSPPCQPYTRRGRRRDDSDPRAAALLALIERLGRVQPRHLALENVPPFGASRTRRRLLDRLDGLGFRTVELQLCPSRLGMPNLRRRYFLVASRGRLAPAPALPRQRRPLADFLDPDPDPRLYLEPGLVRRYAGALHIVDAADPGAVTACFTAAYGRSPVRSGSYLRTAGGVRRFSPQEILRLLGFPPSFSLPPGLPRNKAWALAGSSLSVPCVRAALARIPELARERTAAA